ncbi:MAG: exodeoxyribonuclease VII large subunit [Planctomycetota bacterium]
MSRKPFDPDAARGGDDLFSAPARRERQSMSGLHEADQISVGQLSELIKQTLEQRVPSPLRVVGEISNFNDRKHWYFSLKDADAVVSCVMWASSAARMKVSPRDGDAVVATGHVSHYGPQGRTQLYVTNVQPVGTGSLEQQFRERCDELRRLGYFDDSIKTPLPPFPRRIAVITSATSAALQDVLATAAQRCPAVGLLLVDARVQGENAASEVATAIQLLDDRAEELGIDAILVTRGGGSLEDLWPFNERSVADATHTCRTPIVAAIGHESDTTIIELVADLRAATPTQAIMRLVPDTADLIRQIEHGQSRLRLLMRRGLERRRERLDAAARFPAFKDPRAIVNLARDRIQTRADRLRAIIRHRVQRDRVQLEQSAGRLAARAPSFQVEEQRRHLDAQSERLRRATRWRLEQARQRVERSQRTMSAVNPASVLHRGYSLTTTPDGALIRSVNDVSPGMAIVSRLADGDVDSTVDGDSPKRAKSPPRPKGASQLDLFSGGG